jgi:hypothetical protein
MKWERELYVENTRVDNNIKNGYRYLVDEDKPFGDDVDNERHVALHELLSLLENKTFYHVGFRFGNVLINVHRLFPNVKIGGCDIYDLCLSFGTKHFGLKKYDFALRLKEYPYFKIEGQDFLYLGELTHLLPNAIQDTEKYVAFFAAADFKCDCVVDGHVEVIDDTCGGVVLYLYTKDKSESMDDEWASELGLGAVEEEPKTLKLGDKDISYEFPEDTPLTESVTFTGSKNVWTEEKAGKESKKDDTTSK